MLARRVAIAAALLASLAGVAHAEDTRAFDTIQLRTKDGLRVEVTGSGLAFHSYDGKDVQLSPFLLAQIGEAVTKLFPKLTSEEEDTVQVKPGDDGLGLPKKKAAADCACPLPAMRFTYDASQGTVTATVGDKKASVPTSDFEVLRVLLEQARKDVVDQRLTDMQSGRVGKLTGSWADLYKVKDGELGILGPDGAPLLLVADGPLKAVLQGLDGKDVKVLVRTPVKRPEGAIPSSQVTAIVRPWTNGTSVVVTGLGKDASGAPAYVIVGPNGERATASATSLGLPELEVKKATLAPPCPDPAPARGVIDALDR